MAKILKGTFRVVRSFRGPAGSGQAGDIVTDPPAYYRPFVEKLTAKEAKELKGD